MATIDIRLIEGSQGQPASSSAPSSSRPPQAGGGRSGNKGGADRADGPSVLQKSQIPEAEAKTPGGEDVKDQVLDMLQNVGDPLKDVVALLANQIGMGGVGKTGPAAFAAVAIERKLRDSQNGASRLQNRLFEMAGIGILSKQA